MPFLWRENQAGSLSAAGTFAREKLSGRRTGPDGDA